MKSILAVALIAGFVAAEVPSHSYLPPPPNRGYSSGPAVVAARALDPTHQPGDHNGDQTTNGFARSSQPAHEHGQGLQSRFSDDQGYDQVATGYPRSGLDDVNADASYHFGYDVNDVLEGTEFGHHESRVKSRARGEYHVVLPDGRRQTVSYEADERGFKPQISYEDTEDIARSSPGYDTNANIVRASTAYGPEQDGGNGNGYHGNDQNGGRPNARSNGYN